MYKLQKFEQSACDLTKAKLSFCVIPWNFYREKQTLKDSKHLHCKGGYMDCNN